MKRYGNIYHKIYDIDNLRIAYKKARRGKTHYYEVKKIDKNPDKYLYQIQDMLKNKTFTTSEYEVFQKNDGGKERTIYRLPFFPDRIVQWAIMIQIEEIIVNRIPQFSCASIPKRGIMKASRLIRKYLKNTPNAWYLQLDIKKFFPSIQHRHPKAILKSIFKDNSLLHLLFNIIDSIPFGLGVPIGNYTSQYIANLSLLPLLKYIKHKLKIKYVVIYMDDIIIIGTSQKQLQFWHKCIELFLWQRLNLLLKPNFKLGRVTKSQGIDFVGYVHYSDYTFIRTSIKNNMIKVLKRIKRRLEGGLKASKSDVCSIFSYKGWLDNCNGGNLYYKYMYELVNYIKKGVAIV